MPDPIKQLPEIPAERTLKLLAGRWKASLLYHLFDGPRRLSELARLVPRANQKVLIEQLKELDEHGVIRRTVFAEVPPRVEYATTELGQTLRPVIAVLCDWGRRHADASQTPFDECDRDNATSRPVERERNPSLA
jgi:DNA-binding HxlR family transcriptional regulator